MIMILINYNNIFITIIIIIIIVNLLCAICIASEAPE